jgi:nitrite reductase/ring-hydroxylating ferredoxin subunit
MAGVCVMTLCWLRSLPDTEMDDYWRLRTAAPDRGTLIGAVEELPEGHAREYIFGRGVSAFRMIVVRQSGAIYGYLNLCPHMSLPLNQEPGVFLSHDGQTLLCSRHFAQFEIDGGLCIAGACLGSRLDRIPVHVDAEHNMRIG